MSTRIIIFLALISLSFMGEVEAAGNNKVFKHDKLISDISFVNEETLWFARCIFSETNRRSEMFPVAWVIRNRVDLEWNNFTTYQNIILDPRQFSAFNYGRRSRRRFYMNLPRDYDSPLFQYAIKVAHTVKLADVERSPFLDSTPTHFYSPVSMRPRWRTPSWARRNRRVYPNTPINNSRFRFYEIFQN